MKLKALLLFAIVSICSVHGAWARTAPVLPSGSASLEDNGTYYIFNVAVNQFIGYDGKSDTGIPVTFQKKDDKYRLYIENGQTLYRIYSNSYVDPRYTCYWATSSTDFYVETTESSTEYWIYSAYDAYINFDESHTDIRAYYGREDSQVWRLVSEADVNDYRLFVAKLALFNALNATDGTPYFFDAYEAVYNNPASTIDELMAAATATTATLQLSQCIKKHELNDYPVTLYGEGWNANNSKNEIYKRMDDGGDTELTATFALPEDGVLVYKLNYATKYGFKVFVDGVQEKYYSNKVRNNTCYNMFYITLSAGEHQVVWKFEDEIPTQSYSGIYNTMESIGLVGTPQIAVNLLEPGSLGTEVLYQVDDVKNVRSLKITGPMNSDDWAKISMMTKLFKLDLSEAAITTIPYNVFTSDKNTRTACANNLCWIKLPQTLECISSRTFAQSLVEDFDFPSTMTSIGSEAFFRSMIRYADIRGVKSIGNDAFEECRLLESICLADDLESIGNGAFYGCYSISPQTIHLPKTLASIGERAFYECLNLNFRFPKKYLEIGREAFYSTAIDSIIMHASFSTINETWSPFYNLPNLVYAEYPVEASTVNLYTAFNSCPNLNKFVLKSPTKVIVNENGLNVTGLTIVVPSYLVNSYKLDSYWYNAARIEGFDTSDIQDWTINENLVMNENERFGGTPDVTLNAGWKLNGNAAQSINNLTVNRGNGMIISNCNNVVVNGTLSIRKSVSAKTWYYFSLPFDVLVSDINMGDAQYAIRYYDGANRALNGSGSNWKNYAPTDVITAGTGFIIQASKATTAVFTALENGTKQNIVSTEIFEKALDVNDSESQANKGWNLVGNPWQSYYNIHKLNFTAPITVWNGSSYAAYSIIDDDYAILPNNAFFVQCPDEINSISFPIDGRQLTNVIESQNAARADQPRSRRLIDVELSYGEQSDKTRFVLNPQASLSYETSCDASKFMSMDASVPQIYTIEQGTQMAINERPLADGTVQIGFKVAQSGQYTITAPRNQFQNIVLVDSETGIETLLADGVSYTFTASAGTWENRFMLRVGSVVVTVVNGIENAQPDARTYYNLNGQRIDQPQNGLYIVNGKKVIIK